jgi:hypothetical protein
MEESTEFEIIKEYRKLKQDPFTTINPDSYPSRKDDIIQRHKRFAELKEKLNNVREKTVLECKNNLLKSIDKVFEIISANKLGYPLSRNQGLSIENFVYGKILGILSSAMDIPYLIGWSDFYFEESSDFDSTNIKKVLEELKGELNSTNYTNYLTFENTFEKYKEKILELWKEENRNSN